LGYRPNSTKGKNFYRLLFTPPLSSRHPILHEAFDIKAHHDVYKDPTLKGLAFRIYGLAKNLENLPVVKRAARRYFFFDDGVSDGDDGSHSDGSGHGNDGGDGGDDGGTPTN
jgi:hypothetical protein